MAQPLPHDTIQPARSRLRYDIALLAGLIPVALATYLCIGHLDTTISLAVRRYLFVSKAWSRHTSSIPDALLILVVFITVGAYVRYRHKISRNEIDIAAFTYKMLAITAPASFIAKSITKYAFGRVTTREWLLAPNEYGFHWFSGEDRYTGFPSGHMAVFAALIAVLWRLHPRYRPAYLAFLLLLALALIATNYHFLSDVIAGTYLGLLVEAFTCCLMCRDGRFQTLPKASHGEHT